MARTASVSLTGNGTWTPPAGVSTVRIVATKRETAAKAYGLVIDSLGNAWGWGQNFGGCLGVNLPATGVSSPVIVTGGLKFQLIQNAALRGNNLFLTTGGDAYVCGPFSAAGPMGDGGSVPLSNPTIVLGGLKFQNIYVGDSQGGLGVSFFGIDLANNVWGWGANSNGTLGINSTATASSPIQVQGTQKFKKIVTDGLTTCGLNTSGALYAWGFNAKGQIGDGTSVSKCTPTAVVGGLTFIDIAVAVGINVTDNYNCTFYGLTAAGAVYAWGSNGYGQIGDGTTVAKCSPTLVSGIPAMTRIFGGLAQGYAINYAGTMAAWGNSDPSTGNLLPDGSNVSKSIPVGIAPGINFKKVITNPFAQCGIAALDVGANLYTWGFNFRGNGGDGSTVQKSTPTLVIGGYQFKDAIENPDGSMWGITTAGDVLAWGNNGSGSIGNGNNTSVSSPSTILKSNAFRAAAQDTVWNYSMEVIPGNSYTYNTSAYYTQFGNNVVGQGSDVLMLYYEE